MTYETYKHDYLNWLSSGTITLNIANSAFTCSVSKVNEHIENSYLPVISISNVEVPSGYTSFNPAFKELMDFIYIVDKYNPRRITFLAEVPMYLYPLVDSGYTIVDAVVEGKAGRITLLKGDHR